MKQLQVGMELLRQLVVELVGREEVGYASGSGGGTMDGKVTEDDEIDARVSSPQPGRELDVSREDVRRQDVRRSDERRRDGRKWE